MRIRPRPAASATLRPVAWDPVKKTPSSGCVRRRAATGPAPYDGREDVPGDPGLGHEVADGPAGERRELRRLVEDRVAGQERGHEHVRAHEVRVVPGRDVRHHAQRLVGHPLFEALRRLGVDRLVLHDRAHVLEEEVDPAGHGVQLGPGLPDGLAHLGREDARQLLFSFDEPIAEAPQRGSALRERHRRPAGLRVSRRGVLAGDRRLVVLLDPPDHRARGRVRDVHEPKAVV